MADTIEQQILRQSLDFSYSEIQSEHPDWSKKAVDDYFYKQSNIYSLAANSKSSDDQVADNTAAILVNETNISINSGAIVANASDISDNADNITTNATNIGSNTTTIGTNSTNITNVTNAFNMHNGSSSQHGVTGDNIGTEDYAQSSIGGVVLLAALVADAVDSAVSVDSPDATDLPTVLTLANETKADVNQLVTDLNAVITQLNEFLANNKTAKQMDA